MSIVYLGGPAEQPEPIVNASEPTNLLQTIRGSGKTIDFFGGKLGIEAVEIVDVAIVIRWEITPDLDIWQAFPVEGAEFETDLDEVVEVWAADELRRKAAQRMVRLIRNSELTDDVGAAYAMSNWSKGSNWSLETGSHSQGPADFRPAPGFQARRLRWTWLDTTLEIPLR